MNLYLCLFLCSALSLHGIRNKSLSFDGGIAAFLLGMIIFSQTEISWSLALIGFYFSGSALTKVGSKQKQKYEESYVHGGQRNWVQVLSNGLTGAILSIIHQTYILSYDPCKDISNNLIHWILFSGYVAHFSCWYFEFES